MSIRRAKLEAGFSSTYALLVRFRVYFLRAKRTATRARLPGKKRGEVFYRPEPPVAVLSMVGEASTGLTMPSNQVAA